MSPTCPPERSVLVELTHDGGAAFDQAHPDLLATEAALLEGLSGKDRAALARLLAKLPANLEPNKTAAPAHSPYSRKVPGTRHDTEPAATIQNRLLCVRPPLLPPRLPADPIRRYARIATS